MSKIMAQGAYGCVYRPGIKCNGTVGTKEYVSKIQEKRERTMNEPILGKLIADKIKFSERYFSPALSVCEANLTKINKQELGKCEVIHQDSTKEEEYVNIKVKYVGENDLAKNMKTHREKDNSTFLAHMLDSHQYLVEAIEELEKQKIVHHDIKWNNVMYSDSQHVPIIIDFGVSFQLKDLHVEEKIQDIFFTAYEKYPPWCLEITLIAAIVKVPGWEKKPIDMKTLQTHLFIYSEKNPIMKVIREKNTNKPKWEDYLNTFSKDNGKTAVNKLLGRWNTWDVYSIHVMFVDFMRKAGWLEHSHDKCIAPYIEYVFSQILAIPPERDDPAKTAKELEKIRRNIKKTDFMEFLQNS
jgi:serine/threonine protein kinase